MLFLFCVCNSLEEIFLIHEIITSPGYEIQVLDSYENRTYSNGQAGSVYKQHSPLVNASKKPR